MTANELKVIAEILKEAAYTLSDKRMFWRIEETEDNLRDFSSIISTGVTKIDRLDTYNLCNLLAKKIEKRLEIGKTTYSKWQYSNSVPCDPFLSFEVFSHTEALDRLEKTLELWETGWDVWRPDPDRLILRIHEQGEGIPKERMEELLVTFFRVTEGEGI